MSFKSLQTAIGKHHKKQYLSQNAQIHNQVRKPLVGLQTSFASQKGKMQSA